MPTFPIGFPLSFATNGSLDWVTVEDAIRAWVKSGSGFADGRVWWADQKIPQGQTDFIVCRLGPVGVVGTVDELIFRERDESETPATGEEYESRVSGVREFTCSIQAFCTTTVGNRSGRAVLEKVQAALRLPTVRAALESAGLSPFDPGTVQNISRGVEGGATFEGRGLLEVRFYVRESVSEYTGYFDTVETESFLGPPDSGTRENIDI